MRRLPAAALTTLVVATVAALFFVQHLKVTTPFFSGQPNPAPNVIDPVGGGMCRFNDNLVSFRETRISFYLQHRADHVNMYVVNSEGDIVAQVATDRYMPKKTATNSLTVRRVFYWNGRSSDGSVVPDGNYYFRVALIAQGRNEDIGGPITVQSTPPHPDITSVKPQVATGGEPVTIHFNENIRSEVLIYRTDLPGPPHLVYRFATKFNPHGLTSWDGLINGSPAPAGTYLIGLRTTNRSCTTNSFPVVMPPQPGTTPHAGVTVRYLAAAPPLTPVAAGSRATVSVDSRGHPYSWTLALPGARKPISRGPGTGVTLAVRLPRGGPGLYILSLRSGANHTSVPLIASAPASSHPPRILVVLPTLTWQGENPVDDVGPNSVRFDGDGLPNTLTGDIPIPLSNRVFANGLPAGLPDIEGLLAFLNKDKQPYDLTTDLALAENQGPALDRFKGVVLAGDEVWLPHSLQSTLRSYAQGAGNVLSLGIGSLQRTVTLSNGDALDPSAASAVNALGARPAQVVSHVTDPIIVAKDDLHLFSNTSGAFQGYSAYEPFTAVQVPGGPSSEAAVTTNAPAIVGYHLGKGTVVQVGLVGFGSSLRTNTDAQAFILRLWQVLKR